MNTLHVYIQTFFDTLLRVSIIAGLLVGLVMLLRTIPGNKLSPKWRYWLWLPIGGVLLLAWVPDQWIRNFSFSNSITQSETSIISTPDIDEIRIVPSYERPTRMDPVKPVQTISGSLSPNHVHEPKSEPIAHPSTSTATESKAPVFNWKLMYNIIVYVWLLGATSIIITVLAINIRMHQYIRRQPRITDHRIVALLDRCKRTMGMTKSIPLILSGKLSSPTVYGLFAPRILLSDKVIDTLTDEEFRFVFQHELAHIKRNDIAVNVVSSILLAIHWFNPVMWYAYFRMREDQEIACDALALTYLDEGQKMNYGYTIIKLLEQCTKPRQLPSLVHLAGNKQLIKRRIIMIAEFRKKSYRISVLGLVAILMLQLVGCTALGFGGKDSPAPGKDEAFTLRVLTDSKLSFGIEYGNLFRTKFPKANFEIIETEAMYDGEPDSEKEIREIITEQNPDVIIFSSQVGSLFEDLAQEGKLLAIDPLSKRDKFDMENIYPTLIESIRNQGNGSLYGLSPFMSGSALYYNKDLFEEYGVPLPKDWLSWEQILQLAQQFPSTGEGENRIYGFDSAVPGAAWLLSDIGESLGDKRFDEENMKVSMQSETWKNAMALLVQSLKSDSVFVMTDAIKNKREQYDKYNSNPFATGHAAMVIKTERYINELHQAQKVFKLKPINWGVVTVPVNPKQPEYTNLGSYQSTIAINANSPNHDLAWEFVKYVNGDAFAKIKSKSNTMMTRTAYLKDKEGRSLEPFVKLRPNPEGMLMYSKIPANNNFFLRFLEITDAEISLAVAGNQTTEQALAAIQNKVQLELDQAKLDHDNGEVEHRGP